jgi:hypothetical protein
MKSILLACLFFISLYSSAQYIGIKAKYTDTRLVPNDDPTLQDSRDNRLVLSFYEVTFNGTELVWTPTVLSNYDIWIEPAGLQFGNLMGGVLDSVGNNYPGYSYTAPRAVSYYNSMGTNYFDCVMNYGNHYVINGHELDCGWVRVSTWEWNESSQSENEFFNAPNINIPWFGFPHPYYFNPGNVNFNYYDLGAGPPYNLYNFVCGTLQLVMKGLLSQDTGSAVILPVRFAFVQGELNDSNADIQWSNLTESEISVYTVERSANGSNWTTAGTVLPLKNDGGRADYNFQTLQSEDICYYRIKATENNGSYFYSNIIVLKKQIGPSIPQETSRILTVYPNPISGDQFSFRLTNAEKGRYISAIISPDGKQLKQKMIEHDGGDLVREIQTTGLLPGVYRLVIRSANYKYAQTFMYGY